MSCQEYSSFLESQRNKNGGGRYACSFGWGGSISYEYFIGEATDFCGTKTCNNEESKPKASFIRIGIKGSGCYIGEEIWVVAIEIWKYEAHTRKWHCWT